MLKILNTFHSLRSAFVMLAALLYAGSLQAENFIWHVPGKTGHQVYLVGAVHIMPPSAYPLPEAFEQAFAESEILLFETDVEKLGSSAANDELHRRAAYPLGERLSDNLEPAMSALIQGILPNVGLSMADFQLYKPWYLADRFQIAALKTRGYTIKLGLDNYFHERALAEGKPTRSLASVDDHIRLFWDMSKHQAKVYLEDIVNSIDLFGGPISKGYDQWKEGDVAAMAADNAEFKKKEPGNYNRLLKDRNLAWLPQIEALLNQMA